VWAAGDSSIQFIAGPRVIRQHYWGPMALVVSEETSCRMASCAMEAAPVIGAALSNEGFETMLLDERCITQNIRT